MNEIETFLCIERKEEKYKRAAHWKNKP